MNAFSISAANDFFHSVEFPPRSENTRLLFVIADTSAAFSASSVRRPSSFSLSDVFSSLKRFSSSAVILSSEVEITLAAASATFFSSASEAAISAAALAAFSSVAFCEAARASTTALLIRSCVLSSIFNFLDAFSAPSDEPPVSARG